MRPRTRPSRGFTLIEILVAAAVVSVAALAGVSYVTQASHGADIARDRVFARQKALSILQELRGYVEGGEGEVAADLDGFDDGLVQQPVLSIAPDPLNPGSLVAPDHPLSGNVQDQGLWRWFRRITVRRFPGVNTRDLRICTVRMFRFRPGEAMPGEAMAEVSSVVRTIGDAYPTTQVYDVYLLALENIPGWWVYMDSIKPFVDATLQDLEARNPGLEFRTHWITTSAYGRDEYYAPYTNETRTSTDATPWAYVYPGRMPAGSAAVRYYVPDLMRGRTNQDGVATPAFDNGWAAPEAFSDGDGDGMYDVGESFVDANANSKWDAGNPWPYALADQHNHAMRWPEENERFQRRVAAGVDREDVPTWRLLLDELIAQPDKFHNAIFVNLHGELLPMPAVRNYSDAARDPATLPGWRAVAHPERLRPRRTQGNDAASDAPRWRVYAYKADDLNSAATLMTQREPFADLNADGKWEAGEAFADWNGDGRWSDGVPISIDLVGIDCSAAPNAASSPTLLVKRLPGGIDADGSGAADTYRAFETAARYPETWKDLDGDGVLDRIEPYLDLNGNGSFDAGEPFDDRDGDGKWQDFDEPWDDLNGDLVPQLVAGPADLYTDLNANKRWDPAEVYWDVNGDGVRNGPTIPILPWRGWDPLTDNVSKAAQDAYVAAYGEPFFDADGDKVYDAAEPLTLDQNGNGRFDGGFVRGEMWYEIAWDAASGSTVLRLHGTPLLCPETGDGRGLDANRRLFDLEYIPCPTPATTAAGDPPFGRDLATTTVDVPKNTARWTIELPLAHLRRGFATFVGGTDGDAADRVLELRTRVGADRTTGVMWPTANHPENLSRAWSWFHASPNTVPFSERYQFQGDPRHSPYADTYRHGISFPNGYNWFFGNLNTNGDARALWPGLDSARLGDGWNGRVCYDVGRYMQWLRTAITKTEAVYTTLTGFSYYYMSIGGDVGYDADNGFANSIPMDGAPFGLAGDVFEDTIADSGTSGVGQSQKYVRSNDGAAAAARSGGYWWSKPWIGELCQDAAFAGQWAPWGNLRASTGSAAQTYRLIRRGDVTTSQTGLGTRLSLRVARTHESGCTSVFNIGTSGSTFHHQYQTGQTGNLVGDGPQLAANYNFPLPTTAGISRPFGLATNGAGGVGPEFSYTTEYPRFSAGTVVNFYNHQSGTTGSGLVRLVEPGANPRAAFVVVNGIDRTIASGSAFIARYCLITLVHSFFAAGQPGTGRIQQLPRTQVISPTIVTEISDPASIPISWKTEWTRWDGRPYTTAYAPGFAEDEAALVHVLLYSRDGGRTWLNVRNDAPETPGTMPWIAGTGPDPARTLDDAGVGSETYVWATPKAKFPEGTYVLRIESYRRDESLHYAHHQEKIYVNR